MQAAEARRRQKVELQAQLDLLNAQEEEERESQLEQHRAYQTQSTAGSSYHASSSRPEVVSPTWPESQSSTQSRRNQWGSHGNESRETGRQRNGQSSHPAFRTMPDPVPMITPTTASTSVPWQRNGSSSSNGQPRQATSAYTPPIPDPSSSTPTMPNPLTSSFINLAVPSKHQTNEYLVNKQKQPLGLEMGWSIDGHIFDVYDLFVAVVRLGGSATVTRRQWWATLAGLLGIPSMNTPHGLRASPEAARQLFAFFTLHLGPLEKMWDETRSAESFPKGPALSHDRASGFRIPVSSARGEEEETRSTYPPPPPQHRESSSNQYNRNQYQSSPPQQPAHPSSMPLHVNPSASSSSFPLQRPPQRQNQARSEIPRQQSSNGVNGLSFTRGEGSTSGTAPSVSPVLHQPVPGRLDAASTSRSDERGTIDPRHISPQSSSSAQTENRQPSSNSVQPASSSKTFTFTPLANYNPPKFASFDHLVATNALTLPKLPANVNLNLTGTDTEIYAKRCFELRGVVRKMQGKEPTRQVSKEEMTFWQKLLAILRHNPQVVIPGSQPMSEANVPHVPLQPIRPAATGAGSSTQATAGPSTASTDPLDSTQRSKKKRGRPSKQDKLDRELAASIAPEFEAASASAQMGPDGLLVQTDRSPLAKRKRGPRGPYKKKSLAADDNPDSTASGSAPILAIEPAPRFPSNTNLETTTISDAEVAIRHAEAATAQTDIDTTSALAGEGIGSQSLKARKPYTIRVGPDGTPLSERFKKRLVTGNLGAVAVVRSPTGREGSQRGDPGPSTLHAFVDPDLDAYGEVDPDMPRFEGPDGLAAFDAAIGYRGDDEPAALSQIAGTSTGPGTHGQDPNAPKVKNPKRVEASKQRWEKYREERAAARVERRELELAAQGPAGAPRKSGGFSVPGAALKAATKRWSLQHAALAAPSDQSSSSTSVFSATPIRPMVIASPKRLISLSTGGPSQHDREVTPSQGSLRHRAGSLKPRSSLPLRLTPAPRRDWSSVPSQEPEPEMGYDGGNEFADVQWMPEEVTPAKGKGKGVVKQTKAPRSSLPAHLGAMGPPLSTERPKTRADKGKGVDRNPATPEPSRLIQTRREKAAVPEVSIRASRHSLPSASTLERVSTRASSVALSQAITRGRASVASASPATKRRASSSQPRIRLIPEIEIITPRRYVRLSPVRPASIQAEVPKIKVEPRAQPTRVAQKVQPKAKPLVRVKTKPRPKRRPTKYVRVVIPIRRRRRADLIVQGHYDPFRDDDSEAEEERRNKRYGHPGLRPKVPLPRGSQARTARPMAPEVVPVRFVARAGDDMDERYRSVLAEETILKRSCERECGWKGCDATLASEWHLARHVAFRQHAAQGFFKAGIYGETILYRCHWEECEQPCFASLGDLEQHLKARHISRVLSCPYPDCGLGYSTLSHLTRHVTKHHDSPSDLPVPLAYLSDRIPPPPFPDPPQLLPETARTDILITPAILGSTYPSVAKQEACRLLVLKNSFAPEEPILHVEHPPHILQPLEEEVKEEDTVSEAGSYYTILEGGLMTKERVLDEVYGRPKRTLFPVIDIRVTKRSKVGTAADIVHPDLEDNGLDGQGGDHELQPSSAELPIHNHDTNTTGDIPDRPASVDHQIAQLTDLAPIEPTPLFTPLEEVQLDLGEPTEFEDPLDDGTPYSPVVGPRPDDILFDLSDDNDEEQDADQTQRSESEVWAELEDQEMTQAYTPAGMLGDYELSDDEEGDTPDGAGNAEADDETGMDAIRAAILQPQSDEESATRLDNGQRGGENAEGEGVRIAGPVSDDSYKVAMDGVATESSTNTLDVEVEMRHESEGAPNAIEELDGDSVTKVVVSTSVGAALEDEAPGETSLGDVEPSAVVADGNLNDTVVIDTPQVSLTHEVVAGNAENFTTTVGTVERTTIPAHSIPMASMASEMEIERETLADPFEAVNNPVGAEQVVIETAVVNEVEASVSVTEDIGPTNTGSTVEKQPLDHELTQVTRVEIATELQAENVDHDDTPAIVLDIDGGSPPVDADDVDPSVEEIAPIDVQEVTLGISASGGDP